ncbi:LORF2 protein, partial [Crocuta crocuta]
EWQKMFVSHISDMGLVSRIYKELLQVNNNKNYPNLKWIKNLGHFSKEDIQMVNKHKKRCSTLLVVRKRQLRTTMRHHFIPTRM